MACRDALELLAPAGGTEQLEAGVHFGADAVYLAGRRWGMRARASNFSDRQLAEAITYAHGHGVRIHVALNTLMTDEDTDALPGYLARIDSMGADAVIVSDLGAIALARRHAPHVDIHVSTQASVTNATAALEYARLGARRIVLARELCLPQIADLHARVGGAVELEAFVHGAMCVAVSGRCLLSSHLTGGSRSASSGSCAQPCRWAWSLVEERDGDLGIEMEEDVRGSYLLSSNDLCMVEHLDALAEAGVRSVKIEGRNKGAYYTAVVTNAYRRAIDGADLRSCRRELDATSHRPFSTGFYFGDPTQNPGRVDYRRERKLVGVVVACEPLGERYRVEVTCRNKAAETDDIVALTPGREAHGLSLQGLERWDAKAGTWIGESSMYRNAHRYRFTSPVILTAGDMLCARER